MAWLALFVVVAFIGVIGVVVNVGRLRFGRRTAGEQRSVFAVPRSSLSRPGVDPRYVTWSAIDRSDRVLWLRRTRRAT